MLNLKEKHPNRNERREFHSPKPDVVYQGKKECVRKTTTLEVSDLLLQHKV